MVHPLLLTGLSLLLFACGGGDRSGDFPTCPTSAAHPQWLTGRVIRVHDGDTLMLNTGTGTEHVRLQGIDAPELLQEAGPQAQLALSLLSLERTVAVAWAGRDVYGRLLGQVFSSTCQDINLTLLEQGMAWFYKAYACELDPTRRARYALAQAQAQSARQGLWQQAQPVAPWVYRNGQDPAAPECPF